ncbi:MAG: hypothetical protein ACRD1E_13525, partial [Terriglobales bacterium]
RWVAMQAAPAGQAPRLRMVSAAAPAKRAPSLERAISGMYHLQEDAAESLMRQQTQWSTLKSEAVDSLPYHPNYLGADTQFAATLASSLPMALAAPPPQAPAGIPAALPADLELHARLDAAVSSASAHWGDAVSATLDQPALAADGSVILPQGTRLRGQVVQTRRARWFARGGKLRFIFTRLELPGQAPMPVTAALDAIAGSGALSLDGEGGAQSHAPGPAASYLALSVVANAAVHGDADNAWTLDAGSGTHLRIWGTLMAGLLPKLQPLALGLGFASAGETICTRLLRRGPEVAFPAATALEIRIGPPSR